MNALWWWIDRWRKSTAYTDMTLEQQGAYRNLLDEAWLRGGALPRDPRILAKASGDSRRWPHLKNVLLKRFFIGRDKCFHHETLDEIIRESARRAEKQRMYRARQNGKSLPHPLPRELPLSPSPSPSLSNNPYSPLKSGRGRRRRTAETPGGTTCPHSPRCRTTDACIARTLGAKVGK